METLESSISVSDLQFIENKKHHLSLAHVLRERLGFVRQGGGEKYRRRHEQQGKLFVRERIERLLDPGAPFLELSALAAFDMYDLEAPGAGIVTGIGRVAGREVMIVANDATAAPATKYGGKIVVCQPGNCDTAKSNETMEWTDKTSGVERPARIR